MILHIPSAEPAGGKRRPLRLVVPIPPRASPRACLEAQIDFLLEMLDRIDGDTDLEDNGDLEPSLGYSSNSHGGDDLELDPSELEPSLGSLDRAINQERWSKAFNDGTDLELDPSDYEDGRDAEIDSWPNPLGAQVDRQCRLIVERVPDRQVRP